MAIHALIASAAAAACAALFAVPDKGATQTMLVRFLRRIAHLERSALGALSRTAAIDAVLAAPAAASAADGLRAWLLAEGLALSASEAGAALLVLGFSTALLGIVLAGSFWGALVGAGSYALSIAAYAVRRRRACDQALSAEMPAVFRSLAVSLGSGLTLSQAISYVGSREGSAAAPAFAHCSLRLACGDPYDEVLEDLASRLGTTGAGLLSSALAISHQTGSPLQGLFMRSAGLVERAGELERLLTVKTAQVRLSVRIVCLLPALLVAILLMISPDFRSGLSTPAGIISIALAACMDLAAVLIVRNLSKGVL